MLQNDLFRSPNINTSHFAIRRGHPHLLGCIHGHLLFLIWPHSVSIRLLFLSFCLTLMFKLIWIESRFMRDQASMSLKTVLTIVTAPASTNVALSPVPEDIFSFGYRRILQHQVHNELWRHLLGLVYSLLSTASDRKNTYKLHGLFSKCNTAVLSGTDDKKKMGLCGGQHLKRDC